MTVRAKFTCNKIETTLSNMPSGEKDSNGRDIYKPKEMKTLHMAPVYGNGNPNHENAKFWAATPSGSIQLGTVNGDAAAQFELGKEYYVDFTPA